MAAYAGKEEVDDLPPCKFGADCYRKNADHLKNFSHPKKAVPVAASDPPRITRSASKDLTAFLAASRADETALSPDKAPAPVAAEPRLTRSASKVSAQPAAAPAAAGSDGPTVLQRVALRKGSKEAEFFLFSDFSVKKRKRSEPKTRWKAIVFDHNSSEEATAVLEWLVAKKRYNKYIDAGAGVA
jgi:hypothetical protein